MRVKLGEKVVKARIADNLFTRSKGLMFKKSMEEDEGMLFVFNRECFPRFWMLGMRFPIDIIWINSKNRIVDITKNAKPSLSPWKTYKPREACKYVLEVKADFSLDNGIKIGKRIEIDY